MTRLPPKPMEADLARLREVLADICSASHVRVPVLLPAALPAGLPNYSNPGRKSPVFALAFSGGLDSRFLAFAARHVGFEALLIHASGPHISPEESSGARQWAAAHAFAWLELALNPLAVPAVAQNDRERCYACKHFLFSAFLQATPWPLCDGSNASDQGQYRPGLRALNDLGVASPLALAGLEKARLRALGQALGLDNTAQRARPCLLTRFDYGVRPQLAWLKALAEAESVASHLLSNAFPDCPDFRLRVVGNNLEWHIQVEGAEPRESAALTPRLALAEVKLSRHLASSALAGFLPLRLCCVAQLSGYFDHKS